MTVRVFEFFSILILAYIMAKIVELAQIHKKSDAHCRCAEWWIAQQVKLCYYYENVPSGVTHAHILTRTQLLSGGAGERQAEW